MLRASLKRAVRVGLCAALAAGALPGAASAEIFVLRSGGRLEGRWLNRDQSPRETFVIQPLAGGQITLDERLVERVYEPTPEEIEYEKLRPTYPDTVEGHWALADWCLQNRLLEKRRSHLQRVIELSPDHEEARLALGYRRVQGHWLTRDEEMTARGMVLYKGRYRTPQEIQLWEQEQKAELAQREWHSKLKRWYGWLPTSKAKQALDQFAAVRDPFAIPALAELLEQEKRPQVKLLLINTLAQIDHRSALMPLVEASLEEPEDEVRLTCLDHLVDRPSPDVVKLYIHALQNKSNTKVNRAAVALAALKSPEAVAPLIDALVTTHKFKIVVGSPGQTSASFSANGAGGFSFGSKPPKIIEKALNNEQVLTALIALSEGRNFGYNREAWRQWHAMQKNSLSIDARRD